MTPCATNGAPPRMMRISASPEVVKSARTAGLRYVREGVGGFSRVPKRGAYAYLNAWGVPIRDERHLRRIRSLVIPPAWRDVWICEDPNGHLQATGRDVRGGFACLDSICHFLCVPGGVRLANLNAVRPCKSRKLLTGELAALIGVEDFRRAVPANRLLHGLHAEVRGQRVGEPPGQHPATGPVQDRTQIHNAAPHGDVRNIGGPRVIRARDGQLTQEIGRDLMGRMPLAGPRLPIDRRDAHPPHERCDLPPANGMALLL